jgi:hypothetical protein
MAAEKTSITDIERLMDRGVDVELLPSGEVKMKVRKGTRFRIRTQKPGFPEGQRLRGQDTQIELLLEDGTVVSCPNITSATWRVDSRGSYCQGTFIIDGVEMDVEGVAEDALRFRDEEIASLKKQVADLEKKLRDEPI